METKFKIKGTNTTVDLVPYVRDYIKDYPETVILIGSDSQNSKRKTTFATCIGLYRPGKGAHVLSNVFQTPRYRKEQKVDRLLKEVEISIECANFLQEKGLPKAACIDIDLNPNITAGSHEAYHAGLGWVAGLGYNVRGKCPTGDNEYPYMVYAADSLIK